MTTVQKVANDPSITYFPVGNGDTSLITLGDRTTILIDLNVTQASKDEEDSATYDIHAHLLKEVRRDASGRPHLDAFIITHPDQDHLRGVEAVLFLGDPNSYTDANRKDGLIIVDELWFAPRIFAPHEKDLCADGKAVRKEINRRMDLYKANRVKSNSEGNRIRIIGYTDNPKRQGYDDVTTVPGNTVSVINGAAKADFEFFVHAPFRKQNDDKWAERNDTSLVLQARFTVDGVKRAALAMFGGDAGCAIWEGIFDKSEDDSLEWDLLLAPHHCSWTFFSELPSEEEEPSQKILDLLGKHRDGAIVVSSSKPIKDDDDNPPHFIAFEEYKKVVGEDHFYCTMTHPDESSPEPLYFTMSKNGPVKDAYSRLSDVRSSAALKAAVTTPKTYG